jgi:hypothetical protein
MKSRATALLLNVIAQGALFLGAGGMTQASSTDRLAEFGKKCGLSDTSKARLFAAPDGLHWKEFAGSRDIPESDPDWSLVAFLVHGDNASTVQIDGAGQDFSDSTLYLLLWPEWKAHVSRARIPDGVGLGILRDGLV